MPIPGSDLSRWSHPRSAMASKQAHVSIRDALAADDRLSESRHEVLLQGSLQEQYEPAAGTATSDLVVRLAHRLSPGVAALSGKQLKENASHQAAHEHWQSFRRRALRVMRSRYGDAVTPGRKTIKLARGELHADADLVVTLSYAEVAFSSVACLVSDQHRTTYAPNGAPVYLSGAPPTTTGATVNSLWVWAAPRQWCTTLNK